MKMELLVNGLLVMTWLILCAAFSVLGSADPPFSSRASPPGFGWKRQGEQGAAHPHAAFHISSSVDQSPTKDPRPHNAIRPSSISLAPSAHSFGNPAKRWIHGPAYSHSISTHRSHHARKYPKTPTPSLRGPLISPFHSPSLERGSPGPAVSPTAAKLDFHSFVHPPAVSPFGPFLKKTKASPPSQMFALPPPPPNEDCTSIVCAEPLTYTPTGTPCGCVWPIQVKLSLDVAIYSFFNMVTELAEEIATSVALNHSQVRIMGADADRASQQPEKSTVLINLVPKREKFDYATAFSIYKRFWSKEVQLKASLFGSYDVIYFRYPGLPPSPPSSPSGINTIDDESYPGRDKNGQVNKPLGVDVSRRKKDRHGGGVVAVIVLSAFTAAVICIAVTWLLLLKCKTSLSQSQKVPPAVVPSPSKSSGVAGPMIAGSMPSDASISISSSALTYTGSAKTYTLNDMEKATNNFDASRILGEGGFGLVYRGKLDDEREVAVKVLKRDDRHGGREFLAEVEMLSRLHHRNLVKLIGICTEGHVRCLVYELIPNGSVESHLHGVDKESDPLDWDARMKIALGAARALAYLHEDSSPCVIHRDFKSSNILLEHDFTPKVSDFGLARAAIGDGNKYISTHVMGTFGYLAPEYAMTGHLLVKSDVYSYGVVLLELLTGRKPVDLSQPPGQENLVSYARPLLTSKEGLETIIDPALKSAVPFDTISKVAAIASMCVQPEVSHRPFMGEVVQALKLVCNEFDEAKEQGSRSCSQDNLLLRVDSKDRTISGEIMEVLQSQNTLLLSTSDLLVPTVGLEGQGSGPLRRHSTSGPLRTGKKGKFWQRLTSLNRTR